MHASVRNLLLSGHLSGFATMRGSPCFGASLLDLRQPISTSLSQTKSKFGQGTPHLLFSLRGIRIFDGFVSVVPCSMCIHGKRPTSQEMDSSPWSISISADGCFLPLGRTLLVCRKGTLQSTTKTAGGDQLALKRTTNRDNLCCW